MKSIASILKDKKKHDFFIYGFGQAFNLISPLLVVPYIVYVCGSDGFGKVGFGFALALFLILIVDYAFEIKGTKEIASSRDSHAIIERTVNTALFSKMLLFCGIVAITLVLVYSVPFFMAERKLYLFSLAVVLAQVFNPVWFLLGVEDFRTASILNIASKITYVALIYMLVVHKGDYILVNLLLGGTSLIFNITGWIIIKSRYRLKFTSPDIVEVRNILKADFSFCVSQLFLSARQHAPVVLTTYFLGFYATGQYKIIEQVFSMFRTFLQMLLKFFYPQVCYKIAVSPKQGFDFWKKYSFGAFVISTIAVVVAFFFSDVVLEFFNASQAEIEFLNPLFRLALLIPLLMSISLPLEQLMFATDKNKAYVRISTAVTLITVAALLLVIKNYGILGIIVSLVLAEVLLIALYGKYSLFPIKNKE